MSLTNVLAVGTAQATSADIVVAAGTPTTLSLAGRSAGSKVHIQIKDSTGAYYTIGELNDVAPARMVAAPGTYRLYREACSTAQQCGVDQST